jgi:hypothetical protein
MTTCTHLDQVEVRQLPDSVDSCDECLKVADPDPQVVDGAVGQASSRSQWTASVEVLHSPLATHIRYRRAG